MEKEVIRFSKERLEAIRRLRMARRLWKRCPLFALTQMKLSYPGYTDEMFAGDLKRRTKKRVRIGKSPLRRYGRYHRMCEYIMQYQQTGNIDYAFKAEGLRKNLTKSYRVKVRIGNLCKEFYYSPLINIKRIEDLVAAYATCSTQQQADLLHSEFVKTAHLS